MSVFDCAYYNPESKREGKYNKATEKKLQNFKSDFFNSYKTVSILGKGSSGAVYLVQHKQNDKKIYAMKVIYKMGDEDEEEDDADVPKLSAYIKMERDIMVIISQINSPFLLRIKCAFQDSLRFYIISEYIPGKDLKYYILDKRQYNDKIAKFYAIEILLGLESLHALDIAHCDLKLDNILVDAEGHIKICDFGFGDVLKLNEKKKGFVGTLEYMAPEIYEKKSYDKMVDWWSYGVILYMMLSGKAPFEVSGIKIDYTLKMLDSFSKDEKDLLQGLLNPNPEKRLGSKNGAEDLKQHKYFKDVKWEEFKNKKNEGPFKFSSGILREDDKKHISGKIDFSENKNYNKLRNFTYVSKSLLDTTSKEFKDDDNN